MTRLFFVLLKLWTVSISFALANPGNCEENLSGKVLKSLKISGFNCEEKSLGNCSYHECTGTLPNYPRPVLFSIPSEAAEFRLHFHGHKLGVYPEYEKSLSSMIKSFSLNSELCRSKQITAFPDSLGKCKTYDEVLKDKAGLEVFFNDLNVVSGQHLKTLPFHISAHSGGGRTVARILNAQFPVAQVSIFDGIYSDVQKRSLIDWYQKAEGKLVLASVKGMSPESYTTQLKKDLGLIIKSSKVKVKGTDFDLHESDRFIHYSRPAGPEGSTKAHYDVLTQTWPEMR
jgi:hypothetical protein